MPATIKPLLCLTAGDLMTRSVVRLTEEMPLRDAALLLFQNRISGAPVVNALGKCVGVFSTFDFLHLVLQRPDLCRLESPALPSTCPFQVKHRLSDGAEMTMCLLPPGVCPLQGQQVGPDGSMRNVCSESHAVLTDWQVVEVEKLPADPVGRLMTADPITVPPATSVGVLARLLIDAHIHRVIVVDDERRPIGMVSSTDILAAVAHADRERQAQEMRRPNQRRSVRGGQSLSGKEMP